MNVETIVRYIHKHFNTEIIIIESGKKSQIRNSFLPPSVEYYFIQNSNNSYQTANFINYLGKSSKTPYLAIYDSDMIFSPEQIIESVMALRSNKYSISYPFSGNVKTIDEWLKLIFIKTLDNETLENFEEYCHLKLTRSAAGCVFFNQQIFLKVGGENKKIWQSGVRAIERLQRCKILGYSIHRANGSAFSFPSINLELATEEKFSSSMEEFLKICSLSKIELDNQVQKWETNSSNIYEYSDGH